MASKYLENPPLTTRERRLLAELRRIKEVFDMLSDGDGDPAAEEAAKIGVIIRELEDAEK